MDIEKEARANIERLHANPYPGRGIVLGRTPDNQDDVQVYWLMGRSENSRNRRLVHEKDVVRTEAVDASKVTDPSLIIYNAMREGFGRHVVSNGSHTDTVFGYSDKVNPFRIAMQRHEFEPDAPNYTPRIMASNDREGYRIAMMSRTPDGRCQRTAHEWTDLPAGYGYCIHTYVGDGSPLPAFEGNPYLLPITSSAIEMVSEYFWSLLDEENRVALVTKFCDRSTDRTRVHIINRF